MRINHKSDFDFRLDLYAADPYGTAVAAGFPDCDFTGKLFIGPSARSRQCYTFSKQGKTLVNCFDNSGHLHVVVSGHNLASGPLYCELTIRVADPHYPGGFRSVVYSFPLNLYLTDNDAELISPTVSVTLPVMQKSTIVDNPGCNGGDGETVLPLLQNDCRFAKPWLLPTVCSGTIHSGSFAGNIYRNDRGIILLSGEKIGEGQSFTCMKFFIPQILRLGIKDLTRENLASRIQFCNPVGVVDCQIDGDHITFYFDYPRNPGCYLKIDKSPYVSISPYGSLRYYIHCPISEYKPEPVTIDEVIEHIKFEEVNRFSLKVKSNYILQIWGRRRHAPIKVEGTSNLICWTKLKTPVRKWISKKKISNRLASRHLFFRIARKKRGRFSDWLYFKIFGWGTNGFSIIITDETGAKLGTSQIEVPSNI